MKVVILGYMGSGKSIIAKELASKNQQKLIDLDAYIEENEKTSIKEIFEKKGEIYFRKIENKYLKELLKSDENIIIAVGGGTPCYANNMELIKKNADSIYLKATISTLYDRLISEKEKRPLIKNIKDKDLKEFIAKHLFERNNFYNQADKTILVDDKNVAEIVMEIMK